MHTIRLLGAIALYLFISTQSFSQAQCSNFESFSFGIIADCQCNGPSCNSKNMLQDAVDYYNTQTDIQFCAHLGDFWEINFSSLDVVKPIYESLQADHHYTIGNHEFDDNGQAGGLDQATQMALPSILGMPDWYYDFSVFNWRFISIESYELGSFSALAHPEKAQERDSLLNLYPGPSNAGCLSQEQLDYIEGVIANAHSNDENVVLFGHHPLVNSNPNIQIRNAQSLIDILESYDNVVAYMNGHAHASDHIQQNGIHYLTFNDMKLSAPSTFAVVDVKYDTLSIQGFGNENDYTLTFTSKIQILDADNDGVCDADDQCANQDDAIIGTACNDGDACTLGEVYDAICNCNGGVFQDADNDGVCDAEDACPNFDDALIATTCDDGDPCTTGEVYDANCNCNGGVFQDADNDGVCDAYDACPNSDDALIGTTCDDGDPCTSGEAYDANCNCNGVVFQDADNDGVCDADDACPNMNDAIIGTSCDDADPCTAGEVYDANCNCSGGVFQDADNDSVCDVDDTCPGLNDALIGTICNDSDPCTIGELFDANCNCNGGVFQDADNDGTCDANDECPNDPNKTVVGMCGCGFSDTDSDMDNVADCNDACPNDPNKTEAGLCGCGAVDIDSNNNDICDSSEDGCETINYENFESGSGPWQTLNLVQNDAERVLSTLSPEGQYSMRIRDNSGDASSTFTSIMDLSQVGDVKIEFQFQSKGFSAPQSFYLELSLDGGVSYSQINEWICGIDFNDGAVYTESIEIANTTFTATSILRFRCNGNINSDEIYLDNIHLKSCENSCVDNKIYTDNESSNMNESAIIGIETNRIIDGGINVEYTAGEYILFTGGFEVKGQIHFHAYISACN